MTLAMKRIAQLCVMNQPCSDVLIKISVLIRVLCAMENQIVMTGNDLIERSSGDNFIN
jgi:hypothetical protein